MDGRADARYCSSGCRQAAYRERKRVTSPENLVASLRFAEAHLSPQSVALTRHIVSELSRTGVTATDRD